MSSMPTPTFAVIGNPVKHSRSPRIHSLFGEQLGIDLQYQRIESPIDQFAQTVETFFAQGGLGLNVTVPFKLEAWDLACANLSQRARQAMAVNTLWRVNGVLHGCNTDGVGLVDDLRRQSATLRDAQVLIVGAGGAARGIIGPLLDAGCAHLRVVNRTASRATELIHAWPAHAKMLSAGGLPQAARPGGWDIVINASASSLSDQVPDLPKHLYASESLAYDMMYDCKPTPFMDQAASDGAKFTSDGLGMLVGQAAESFSIWHGVKPDVSVVINQVRAELTP